MTEGRREGNPFLALLDTIHRFRLLIYLGVVLYCFWQCRGGLVDEFGDVNGDSIVLLLCTGLLIGWLLVHMLQLIRKMLGGIERIESLDPDRETPDQPAAERRPVSEWEKKLAFDLRSTGEFALMALILLPLYFLVKQLTEKTAVSGLEYWVLGAGFAVYGYFYFNRMFKEIQPSLKEWRELKKKEKRNHRDD